MCMGGGTWHTPWDSQETTFWCKFLLPPWGLGITPSLPALHRKCLFTRTQLPSSLFKWNNLGQCQHVASTLEHSPLQTCSHGQSTVSTVQVTGSSKHCPGPLLPQSAPQTHFHSRERGVPWQERSLVDCALVAGIFCSSVSVSSQLLRVNWVVNPAPFIQVFRHRTFRCCLGLSYYQNANRKPSVVTMRKGGQIWEQKHRVSRALGHPAGLTHRHPSSGGRVLILPSC